MYGYMRKVLDNRLTIPRSLAEITIKVRGERIHEGKSVKYAWAVAQDRSDWRRICNEAWSPATLDKSKEESLKLEEIKGGKLYETSTKSINSWSFASIRLTYVPNLVFPKKKEKKIISRFFLRKNHHYNASLSLPLFFLLFFPSSPFVFQSFQFALHEDV